MPGDVLLSHKGTVGRVAVAPVDSPAFVCSPQTTFWRSLDQKVIDQRYLAYVLKSPNFQSQLATLAGQTDMAPYASLTDQRSMFIDTPAIGLQRGIAEVLGALDDKVAVNDRQLKLTDQLAETIFACEAPGLLGREVTFADIAEINGGGTPRTSTDEYWGGDIWWATPTDVTALAAPYLDATARTITDAGLAACASSLYPAGSILMTSRATVGAFAIAQVPVAVNQGFIVANAKNPDLQWWLFHDMRSRVQEFLSFANGATFLELPRGRFKSLPVRLPSNEAARRFNEQVSPLHALAVTVVRENRRLAVARDELLPLLMSGKVRVRDAERRVEDEL